MALSEAKYNFIKTTTATQACWMLSGGAAGGDIASGFPLNAQHKTGEADQRKKKKHLNVDIAFDLSFFRH